MDINKIYIQNSITQYIRDMFSTDNIIINTIITLITVSLIPLIINMMTVENIIKLCNTIRNKFIKKTVVNEEIYTTTLEYERNFVNNANVFIDNENEKIITQINIYLYSKNIRSKNNKIKYGDYLQFIPLEKVQLVEQYSDIYLKEEIIVNTTKDSNKNITSYIQRIILESKNSNSVEKFIIDMHKQYQERINVNSGKLYIFCNQAKNSYKRYDFTSIKNFDNIFIPNKNKIVTIIDKFLNKKLLYNKLVFCLYGEPGCGKTTFIKSLANHTKRHIKYIRLSLIEKFEDLIDIFHGTKIQTNENMYNYKNNEVIIVLEDIDAESRIIHKRDYNKESEENKENKKKDKIKVIKSITLSDMLQVFDGLFEAHGIIIVFTTNHIEQLDSAFIRSGRVTFLLEMKKMIKENIFEMIMYYFKNKTLEEIKDKLDNIVKDYTITPSDLENMCIKCETFEELYDAIIDYYKK